MADGEAPDAKQPVGKEVGFAVDDEVRQERNARHLELFRRRE